MPDKDIVKDLEYDPDTGIFTWKFSKKRTNLVGQIAGSINKTNGYIIIGIYGQHYLAHRLAWLYMTGEWPEFEIDHINKNIIDNRWKNLRKANRSENMLNTDAYISNKSTGIRNVYGSKWGFKVIVTVNRKLKYFGTFNDIELAELVAEEVRNLYHGDFYRGLLCRSI